MECGNCYAKGPTIIWAGGDDDAVDAWNKGYFKGASNDLLAIKSQSERCQTILGYHDGDLLDNVTRFHAYATHEIETLRAGGKRLVEYAQKLQDLLPAETVMKVGTDAVKGHTA